MGWVEGFIDKRRKSEEGLIEKIISKDNKLNSILV
jgi:hypothetical protein